MSDKAVEIAALLAPTIESLGVELLGVEYLSSPGNATLRLYIDVPADSEAVVDPEAVPRSVTIEECEAVSREVSAQLDVEDPISSNYTLEVSSPGLDRPIFSAAQFARFTGETVKVTLRLPQDGRRRLQGVIAGVSGDMITLQVDGADFVLKFANVEKARLVPDWAALGLAPVKPGSKPGAKPKQDKPGRSAHGPKQTKNSTNKPAADKPTQAE